MERRPIFRWRTTGGAGTAGVHWDEGHFATEIMTGYINSTNQISRMTIASLEDVGWSVSYSSSDSYTLPPCSATSSCVILRSPSDSERAYEIAPPFEPVTLPIDRSGGAPGPR